MRKLIVLAIISIFALTAGHVTAAQGEMEKLPEYAPPGAIIGMSVFDVNGEMVGELKDVVYDWETSRIGYGVISAQDNNYFVPWSAVAFDLNHTSLKLKIDQQTVLTSPPVKLDTPISHATSLKIHQHYGVAPYWQERIQSKPRILTPGEIQPNFPLVPEQK